MVRAAVAAGTVVVALSLGLGVLGVAGAPRASDGAGSPGAAETSAPARSAAETSAPAGPAAETSAPAGPAAEAGDTTAPAPVPTYVTPLDPPVVVARPFDAPPQPWAAGHRGVDLAAHPGQVVRAPAGGVVSFAGTVVDRGVVTMTHADGLRSSLEPVTPSVRTGQRVLRAQSVGAVAGIAGHCAPATCLHWGLRRGETYLDPMRWVLDRGPVVLLPTG